MSRWQELDRGAADEAGAAYRQRFESLARSGVDVHGEASRCTTLVAAPARVLDAGCGTGRVAIELARRGYQVVGVDLDAGMLAQARTQAPELTWIHADLAGFDPGEHGVAADFDLVVAAGNVIPLVAAGSEPDVLANLALVVRPRGLVVAGFGLTPTHLPLDHAPFGLAQYDAWCAAAGLELIERTSTWDGGPFVAGGDYAVSVHRRRG